MQGSGCILSEGSVFYSSDTLRSQDGAELLSGAAVVLHICMLSIAVMSCSVLLRLVSEP